MPLSLRDYLKGAGYSESLALLVLALIWIALVLFVALWWFWRHILAHINDEPLDGFSRDVAESLRELCKETLREFPGRLRSTPVMAAGLGIKMTVIQQSLFILNYLSDRIAWLSRDLLMECMFSKKTILGLQKDANGLAEKLVLAMDLLEKQMSMICAISYLPEKLRFKQALMSAHSLTVSASQQMAKAAIPPNVPKEDRPPLRKEGKRLLAELAKNRTSGSNLQRLREELVASSAECGILQHAALGKHKKKALAD